MRKYFIAITVATLLSPALCYASPTGSVEPYFTTGEKSQTDGIEDRDLSGSFKYYKYGMQAKTDYNIEKNLSLKAGFENYRKDFVGNTQSDIESTVYDLGAGFGISNDEEKSLHADVDFRLRTKRYDDAASLEYDQTKLDASLKYKVKDAYCITLSGGVNNYEYINKSDSDIFKTFLKISPQGYLFDKRLELEGFYRIQWLDSSGNNKDASENIWQGSAAFNTDTPYLYKIKASLETGKENTQDTEDREDSLRYKYTRWDIASYHKFADRLKTDFSYGQKRRNYITDNNDYENWYIKNKSNLKVFETQACDVNAVAEFEHKETDFNKINTKNYIKNEVLAGLSFLKRANWSFKPDFTYTIYDYGSSSTSTETDYRVRFAASKYINEDISLEGYYWYKWKDYKNKSDMEQWTVNISSAIRF